MAEYELRNNFVGFKVERYIPVGFGEMGPHKEAVHVGFGGIERPRGWKSKVPIQNLCFGDEEEMDRWHLNQSP